MNELKASEATQTTFTMTEGCALIENALRKFAFVCTFVYNKELW